jgi:hypothetical protein
MRALHSHYSHCAVGAARAQTEQEITWALGEVGEELQTCSVYFTVIAGLPRAPKARWWLDAIWHSVAESRRMTQPRRWIRFSRCPL